MESHVAELLKSTFGHSNPYDVLGISKSAGSNEINRAYKVLALKYHPGIQTTFLISFNLFHSFADRKDGNISKFQALSAAHSVLADENKRKVFDSTGELESETISDSWYDYFRSIFPAISGRDIDAFAATYQGSEEEISDVVKAFSDHKGDLSKIMECVILAEDGDELRICQIIDAAIAKGGIVATSKYTKQRQKLASGKGIKKRKSSNLVDDTSSQDDLAQMMMTAQARRSSKMADIFAKYGDTGPDISDEAFAAAQSRITGKGKSVKKKK